MRLAVYLHTVSPNSQKVKVGPNSLRVEDNADDHRRQFNWFDLTQSSSSSPPLLFSLLGTVLDSGYWTRSGWGCYIQGLYCVQKGCVNNVGYVLDPHLMPYFGSAAMIRTFDLKHDLILALVKWWRPKTHTFHLPYGECPIILEDVALQLSLPIDGSAVTGVSIVFEPATLFYNLLGCSPDDHGNKFTSLRFLWLKANVEYLLSIAIEQEVMYAI
ncbi:hypothetical protein J1N35_038385 [Gossypium stocksii]|uniref:Aminotransferase-like plant mobile domain-containing protein n=1 Tax=Gossypium stocksii TaxID=47602 RepID=A0A9D3ULW2_9ROSI|nr:hypothetical protein J1N35_038385 [Gossypium stocksii]